MTPSSIEHHACTTNRTTDTFHHLGLDEHPDSVKMIIRLPHSHRTIFFFYSANPYPFLESTMIASTDARIIFIMVCIKGYLSNATVK